MAIEIYPRRWRGALIFLKPKAKDRQGFPRRPVFAWKLMLMPIKPALLS
jgi:hypothetical protein